MKNKSGFRTSRLALCAGAGLFIAGCNAGATHAPSPSAADARSNLNLVASQHAHLNGFSTPDWANNDHLVGRLDQKQLIEVQVHLQLRNQDELKAEIEALYDPESPQYRQFLTSQQFELKYAPTEDDVSAVRVHLEAHGLVVRYIADNRLFLNAAGSAAKVEEAFNTRLGRYQVDAKDKYAPIDEVTLPGDVNAHIQTVIGLSTPVTMKSHAIHRDEALASDMGSRATASCSSYYGQYLDTTDPLYGSPTVWAPLSYAPCGYQPNQIRTAYGINQITSTINGSGQTVAIVDAFMPPNLVADATKYFSIHDGANIPAAGQIITVQAPGTPGTLDTGWYDEATLDVEAVHAIAPGAKIVYVAAASPTDSNLIAALNYIISNKLATIVSNSWGELESSSATAAWQSVAQAAAAQGIGLYFSSGDSGDESTQNRGTPTVDFPASLPNVTAVGGTSLALDQNSNRIWELAWETGISKLTTSKKSPTPVWSPAAPGSFYFGSGGGTSKVFAQPTYQTGIVPAKYASAIRGTTARRVLPDVAMLADPYTGFLIGETVASGTTSTYKEYAIGGTSLAAPLFAATMALAQQQLGQPIGFAGSLLYKASKTSGTFMDIQPSAIQQVVVIPGTAASIDYHGTGNTNASASGYDNATGLGAISNATAFFASLKLAWPAN